MFGVSAVIPNYNGVELLRENLPSVLASLERTGGDFEILVVDDCSTDESLAFLRETFPAVKVLINSRNRGFSATCNRGFAQARFPVVLCINTDVRLEPGAVTPLLGHFADPEVFAVTPNVLAEREGANQGVMTSSTRRGFIKGHFWPLGRQSTVRENLYAVGACVAYRTSMLRELGGYAEMYSPYLFEDVDLSYRAWKLGWSSLHEPEATVHHASSGTLNKVKKRNRRIIYFRNRFLFHWSNLTDPPLLLANLGYTAFRLAVSWLWMDTAFYVSFWGALQRLGSVRAARRELKSRMRLCDREILGRTGADQG
ncbi:MAG: glycosyl transferase, family 2 [Holophagaceae bacterium]|nr:glycosyl transferase, family 2 [Holophagaceae bacterium]